MITTVNEENGKKFKRAASLILMGAICATSVFSVGAFSRQVNVNADEKTISTITATGDTFKILERVGVEVSQGDTIERCDEIDGSLKLDVKRAFDVSVSKGENVSHLKMSCGTVKDAVEASKIEINENDMLNFPEDAVLVPGMNVEIIQKVRIKLTVDGETKELYVPVGTVFKALEFLGFNVSSNDILSVDISSQVYDGIEINIGRVTSREISKVEEIPFKRVVKKTHLLDNSQKQISSTGKNGQKEVKIKETLVDGNVVKSEEIDSSVIFEPVDEIVLEGTKKPCAKCVDTEASKNVNVVSTVKGSRMVSGSATAYTASPGARTSTGAVPKQGVTVAVNPRIIPYGKKLSIRSTDGRVIWSGVSQDTGGALLSGSAVVDIYMDSKADCIRFGRRKVNVFFD